MSQSQSVLPRGNARFSVKRELADTLQGRIYQGIDVITNKPVVIKEAWRQLVHSGKSRTGHKVAEDFIKERSLLMTLSKLGDSVQGLVKGLDSWDDQNCYYFAMELCEAELFDYIQHTHKNTDYRKFVSLESTKQQIPMHSPNQWIHNVTNIFNQICGAVEWLHSKGFCHLDLSLENVMISDTQNLTVKIIDFGVAQKFENNNFEYHKRVGKCQYMAPEVFARQIFNAKAADVWSLGIMLFMMLIGSPPFQCAQSKSPAFNLIIKGRIKDVLKHWKRLRIVTGDALDLLDKILKYQTKRISLEEILRHSFFESLHKHTAADTALGEETMDDTYDALLAKWGLKEIAPILHNTGWSDPKDWGQLTFAVLKFEIGLSQREAMVFVDNYKAHFEQQQDVQDRPDPDPRTQSHPYARNERDEDIIDRKESKERERERDTNDVDANDERINVIKETEQKPKPVAVQTVNINPSVPALDNSLDDERIEIVNALEEVLDEQMDNLVTAYCQFEDFKQQFLSDNENGIISCPNNSQKHPHGSKHHNVSNNNNHNQRNNPPDTNRPHRDNNDSDENRRRDENGRDNGGSDDNDDGSDDYKMSIECNHLRECTDCAHILTQKSEQLKLFKSLLVTLQKQHEYHTSFENMLCKAIDNAGNIKQRKKSKTRKTIPHMTLNKPCYDPIYRAKRNISISRNLTQDIIPKTVKEPICKVYAYLDRSIGLQYNDGQLLDEDDNKMLNDNYKVLNFDFHDKVTNKPLYCIMEKLELNKKSCYNWKIHDKLYKPLELPSLALPQSSRATLMSDIHNNKFTLNARSVKGIMKRCKWNQIPVFKRKHNAKRITLSITKEQLNPLIINALLNMDGDNNKSIPIVMFHNGSHWIEYVLIVRIQTDVDIGVSLKYNEENEVEITGIHLDKDMIYEQHELISPHHCECLDGFTTIIHDICVGNPDDLANQVKDYKRRYYAFKQLIYKFVNGKDTEKYEILQQHAQMFIKHDNGSLGGYSFRNSSPSTRTVRSISTCSSPPSSSSSSLPSNPVLNEYASGSFSNDWTFIH